MFLCSKIAQTESGKNPSLFCSEQNIRFRVRNSSGVQIETSARMQVIYFSRSYTILKHVIHVMPSAGTIQIVQPFLQALIFGFTVYGHRRNFKYIVT
jgi:phage replication-related protein YjqB (UPF0714/DUF867 family)